MIEKRKIDEILGGYGDFKIATICSHSALQIFHGARQEGVKTIGIVKEENKRFYSSFPYAKPDEFIVVDSYAELPIETLIEREAIIVPHGSFVEYVGEKLDNVAIPIYGNRGSLLWERDRLRMIEWLKKAGLNIPKTIHPEEINGPAIVKFPGAKGGAGYTIVKSYGEFLQKIKKENVIVQEFLSGVRAYAHYFHSKTSDTGYKTSNGSLELLGIDRRMESNADEIARYLSIDMKIPLSFAVIGNEPMTLRESLLPKMMEMGRRVIETGEKLFGTMWGPFCIETIVMDNLEIYAFEISARIVAGTNLYASGSPYSLFMFGESMSMGRRIARELKDAWKKKLIKNIIY